MPDLEGGQTLSLWIYVILVTSLQLWGGSARAAATTSTVTAPPAPVLRVVSRSGDHVTLVCRAPQGHRGVLFALYRVREKVASSETPQGSVEAEFRLNAETAAPDQQDYCCLYSSTLGVYSQFSHYLSLKEPPPPGAAPTSSPAPPPSPVLTVEPPSGRVRRGQTLSFRCSLPVTTPQTQSQRGPKPLTFLLLKEAPVTGETSVVLRPQANQMPPNATDLQAFSLGPVTGGEGGFYACMYQSSKRRRLVNSTVSNVIQVTVTDLLPRPTLTLQREGGVWRLSCSGSAAYPGALFSLYPAGGGLAVAAHRAPASSHRATYPVPPQDRAAARYECRYRAQLGKHWSDSERSLPRAVDWALVAGSFSAAFLFVAVVALGAVIVQRKVRGAAAEKKRREEAGFWSGGQEKDHVADLSPRHSTSQDWPNRPAENTYRSSLWNPLSTFSSPSFS